MHSDNRPHKDDDVNEDLLDFARAWKAHATLPVHPSIGRRLNHALVVAGEDPVPFARATDNRQPSLADLLQRQFTRPTEAPDLTSRLRTREPTNVGR